MLFDQIAKNLNLFVGYVLSLVLRIGIQHENFILAHQIIDHPNPASLPPSGRLPPNLAQTPGAGDQITRLRIGNNRCLHNRVRTVVDQVNDLLREDVGLVETIGTGNYAPLADGVKEKFDLFLGVFFGGNDKVVAPPFLISVWIVTARLGGGCHPRLARRA